MRSARRRERHPGPGQQPAERGHEHDEHDHGGERRERRGAGRHVEAAGDLLAEPLDEPGEERLVVVLGTQQLAPQQGASLVARGAERRVGQQPEGDDHDRVIPACDISSTSYASLRMRWSKYCTAATAVVKGATKAAVMTDDSAWVTTRMSTP